MVKLDRLAVEAKGAARMLSMTVREFLFLVEQGALPPPIQLGKHTLWVVAEIEAVLTDSKIEPEAFVV
ncbi:hypothetical protein HCZ23_05885 [Celeribacter sp. HF31]|uniref:hypothetical protein n=1 Tax=Celeribacter sp. HF31 TaxID=2721558 RepID=UPI0014300365|nr:hypothetical protein [Celeribacter sp. HF31]NIY78996.1 hypothetical protein [Celeribacter sp. HF31]